MNFKLLKKYIIDSKPIKIGSHKVIPAGTEFWSIKNQMVLLSNEDIIVEINHKVYTGRYVYVKPKTISGTYVRDLAAQGIDEYGINYDKLISFVMPPTFLNYYTMKYKAK